MKQKFTYYLHGPSDCSIAEWLREESGIELSPEAAQNFVDSRPFYEVAIKCEVDEKGNVTILGAE